MQNILEILTKQNLYLLKLLKLFLPNFSSACVVETNYSCGIFEIIRNDFYFKLIGDKCEKQDLWIVIKKCCCCSSQVKSGFSINKGMVVENLQEASLVSQRIVFDAVARAGGPFSVIITPLMVQLFVVLVKRIVVQQRLNKLRDQVEKETKAETTLVELRAKRADLWTHYASSDGLLRKQIETDYCVTDYLEVKASDSDLSADTICF